MNDTNNSLQTGARGVSVGFIGSYNADGFQLVRFGTAWLGLVRLLDVACPMEK